MIAFFVLSVRTLKHSKIQPEKFHFPKLGFPADFRYLYDDFILVELDLHSNENLQLLEMRKKMSAAGDLQCYDFKAHSLNHI